MGITKRKKEKIYDKIEKGENKVEDKIMTLENGLRLQYKVKNKKDTFYIKKDF